MTDRRWWQRRCKAHTHVRNHHANGDALLYRARCVGRLNHDGGHVKKEGEGDLWWHRAWYVGDDYVTVPTYGQHICHDDVMVEAARDRETAGAFAAVAVGFALAAGLSWRER